MAQIKQPTLVSRRDVVSKNSVISFSPPPAFITSFPQQENKHLLHGLGVMKNSEEYTHLDATVRALAMHYM